jgi:pantoate--beta-alanine ligase
MKVITTIKEMQTVMLQVKAKSKSIGYVPTMGFLHEGHMSLMKRARNENDVVVISIFVNPLQFGPTEDFSSYPRDFERDYAIAEQEGVDYIFYPSVEEMYQGHSSVKVTVQERTDVLCGKSRPGHFDGVATVLTKLFNIVLPTRAYFGMKDAQQVAVVEGLICDFHFPIDIVRGETMREEDGLAKSSRNIHLLTKERDMAPALYKSLQKARLQIEAGERDPKLVINSIERFLREETNGVIDYIEIYNFPKLEKLMRLEGTIIIALAVKFSKARLIDNLVLTTN